MKRETIGRLLAIREKYRTRKTNMNFYTSMNWILSKEYINIRLDKQISIFNANLRISEKKKTFEKIMQSQQKNDLVGRAMVKTVTTFDPRHGREVTHTSHLLSWFSFKNARILRLCSIDSRMPALQTRRLNNKFKQKTVIDDSRKPSSNRICLILKLSS